MNGEGTVQVPSASPSLGEIRVEIRQWRARTGRTLADLAEDAQVGKHAVIDLAMGRRLPAAWVVERIRRTLRG